MKKQIVTAASVLLALTLAWMLLTGFSVNPSAYITDDVSLSEDGKILTFTAAVGSSMGYIRGYRDEGGGVKPHYLKFYSAWGGLNSPLGAKSRFTLELSPEDTEIYVYHGNRGYELALRKDPESGRWRR